MSAFLSKSFANAVSLMAGLVAAGCVLAGGVSFFWEKTNPGKTNKAKANSIFLKIAGMGWRTLNN
jgi:hypothetical protein